MSAWRYVASVIGVVVASAILGQLVACASLQEALFGPSTPLVNPADDAELFHCRMIAEIDHDMNHDAGGACHIYDDCVIDAGMRGDIGFCNGAGKEGADASAD